MDTRKGKIRQYNGHKKRENKTIQWTQEKGK